MRKLSFVLIGILCLAPFMASAANLKDKIPAPKTKLEEFSAKTGVVIVRGFEEVGTISGLFNTSIKVEAKEFVNVSTRKKEYGITIEVKKDKDDYNKESTSYIDYDEISSLISGIDYISKVKKSVTRFSNFQADYNTKGDFKISTFSMGDKIMVAVSSGRIGSVTAYYNLSSLPEIRKLVEKAKSKIDALKK